MSALTGHRRAIARHVGRRLPRQLKHDNFTRFIVLSSARTGSNLLTSLLDSHPRIDAEGELLKWLRGRDAGEVIDQIFDDQPFFTKSKGFKIFYYHPLDDDSNQVWSRLAGNQYLAVIHLRRRNVLRAIVSRKIADERDEWLHLSDGPPVAGHTKAVTVTSAELESAFRLARSRETEGDVRFEHHRRLTVWYEDLVADVETTFAAITDFLGVRYTRPRTSMRRQNPEPLRELLLNYDEVRERFVGTEWATYFDE